MSLSTYKFIWAWALTHVWRWAIQNDLHILK